jgi:pilus assembly protein CpaD
MKLHPLLAGAAILLALAACRPGAAEFTESEAPKALTLDSANATVAVRFLHGSSRLVGADAARLRAMAASGAIAASDRVTVAPAGGAALAHARFQEIAAALLPYRIIASERAIADVPPDRAVIETGRYLVTLPPCPNWSKQASLDFTNSAPSNFGCANATNLGLSVWSPADLVEGRPLGLADAVPAAAAVQRYEADKVVLPEPVAVGPIAAGIAPTLGGGTGAGSAGTSP